MRLIGVERVRLALHLLQQKQTHEHSSTDAVILHKEYVSRNSSGTVFMAHAHTWLVRLLHFWFRFRKDLV